MNEAWENIRKDSSNYTGTIEQRDQIATTANTREGPFKTKNRATDDSGTPNKWQ